MEIYLGAASFVNFLIREHEKDFGLTGTNLSTIVLWLLPNAKSFSISAAYRDEKDCGSIPIDDEELMNIFGKKDYNTIIRECKRELIDKEKRVISHCPVSRDPKICGNMQVEMDMKEKGKKMFYCHLEPLLL